MTRSQGWLADRFANIFKAFHLFVYFWHQQLASVAHKLATVSSRPAAGQQDLELEGISDVGWRYDVSASRFREGSDANDRVLNRRNVESFVDKFFVNVVTEPRSEKPVGAVPGALVTVVKDGAIMVSKGYGLSDREKGYKSDPRYTLMPLGSVTKLFTVTAALQLVQSGRLSLDSNVENYLKPGTDGMNVTIECVERERLNECREPVTIRHLLTHTAGFEDQMLGIQTPHPESVSDNLTVHLARFPKRIRSPGKIISYSNHGMALLGHIVSRVSGKPFAQYVSEKILEPLGMLDTTVSPHSSTDSVMKKFNASSTVSEKISSTSRTPHISASYVFKAGTFVPLSPTGYLTIHPAGSLHSTASDMGRFMMANLALGVAPVGDEHLYGTAKKRILEEDISRTMQARQVAHHPEDKSSIAFGFFQTYIGGVRVLHHEGDFWGFSSLVALIPEHGVGLFVAYNSPNVTLRLELLSSFIERFLTSSTEPSDHNHQTSTESTTKQTEESLDDEEQIPDLTITAGEEEASELLLSAVESNVSADNSGGQNVNSTRKFVPWARCDWSLSELEYEGVYQHTRSPYTTFESVLGYLVQLRVRRAYLSEDGTISSLPIPDENHRAPASGCEVLLVSWPWVLGAMDEAFKGIVQKPLVFGQVEEMPGSEQAASKGTRFRIVPDAGGWDHARPILSDAHLTFIDDYLTLEMLHMPCAFEKVPRVQDGERIMSMGVVSLGVLGIHVLMLIFVFVKQIALMAEDSKPSTIERFFGRPFLTTDVLVTSNFVSTTVLLVWRILIAALTVAFFIYYAYISCASALDILSSSFKGIFNSADKFCQYPWKVPSGI
ncbi:hypothetical protein HK102_005831 [Quaeritorhiza haematococci]|nr:hypothetical protein HK102_005831 [Quaeritorhiza haematococci]